ncbi:MAG TPA: type II secretion system minor pseudopilin GspJ, partial [Gammaproteobacteria bacterium]|nr:type II secretion system minor pseudopilin GspJ [Gammaproteobacteria bacterium]
MQSVRRSGLTLIELLISVAIFAVLSALAYGGLNNVLLTSTHTQAETKRLTTLQLTMLYLERDINQMIDRPIRGQYGDMEPALVAPPPDAEQPLMSFTRAGWANPAGQLRSQLERVAYDFDEEKEQLVRITWPLLDGASKETEIKATLLDAVTGLKFRFMDDQEQWHTSWPPLLVNPGT